MGGGAGGAIHHAAVPALDDIIMIPAGAARPSGRDPLARDGDLPAYLPVSAEVAR